MTPSAELPAALSVPDALSFAESLDEFVLEVSELLPHAAMDAIIETVRLTANTFFSFIKISSFLCYLISCYLCNLI